MKQGIGLIVILIAVLILFGQDVSGLQGLTLTVFIASTAIYVILNRSFPKSFLTSVVLILLLPFVLSTVVHSLSGQLKSFNIDINWHYILFFAILALIGAIGFRYWQNSRTQNRPIRAFDREFVVPEYNTHQDFGDDL